MGICASIHYPKNKGTLLINNGNKLSPAKVINSVDGKLQEFQQPITASHVLSDHPNTFFLCSSEHMFVNWHVPHVSGDEELEPGQIYFIMPVAKSNRPLSLQELCSLAVKASSAFDKNSETKKIGKRTSFGRRGKTKCNGLTPFCTSAPKGVIHRPMGKLVGHGPLPRKCVKKCEADMCEINLSANKNISCDTGH